MNCEKCGSPFVALNRNGSVAKKRFCSEKCRKSAERKRSAWSARNKEKTRSASKTRELFKPVDGMCGVCGEHPVEGRQKYCSRECSKWAKRCWEAGYEITLPQYESLRDDAGGRCQSCGESEGDRPLQIDHCHSTGAVRGLICNHCNSAAGLAKDSPERLRALADYLDFHSLQQLDEMKAIAGGHCELCGIAEKDAPKGTLHCDHDHSTGQPRGMLCMHCKQGLGHFRYSQWRLQKAIEYLC